MVPAAARDFTTPDHVREVYRDRAAHYDLTANLYYLIGFREWAYRKRAIKALELRPGDTVVEIGCGTGLNFGLIEERIGPRGQLIGVDLTDRMLAQARRRAERHGWHNIELVECPGAAYRFPPRVDAVLSTFALTLEPQYDDVIARGAGALRPGGRWVVADIRLPDTWLRHLTPLLVLLVRPFAVSLEVARRRPWDSLARHLKKSWLTEFYLGIGYIAVGEK
jgi:demethylmenaquinone methyltransferase/2-methoxy-6-polyprenyl-1,4-benzoquinol methylase